MARRNHNTADSRRYYDWLDRSGEDMVCAELLMRDDRCYLGCLFHCQQAIEKALKAYILVKSGNLVDGHNLSWLCKKAASYDKKFREWLDESAVLNRCYIETRYPADLPLDVDYKQVTIAYRMALDMYLFICTQVDAELDRQEGKRSKNS